MIEDQTRIRRILDARGLSAELVMDTYRIGDDSFLKEMKVLYSEYSETELPRQARK